MITDKKLKFDHTANWYMFSDGKIVIIFSEEKL